MQDFSYTQDALASPLQLIKFLPYLEQRERFLPLQLLLMKPYVLLAILPLIVFAIEVLMFPGLALVQAHLEAHLVKVVPILYILELHGQLELLLLLVVPTLVEVPMLDLFSSWVQKVLFSSLNPYHLQSTQPLAHFDEFFTTLLGIE